MKNSDPTIIIAEAGVNHNGSLSRALEMVEVAAEAGADLIKFQSFKAEKLVTKTVQKAQYQIQNTKKKAETQFEMLKSLELTDGNHRQLIEACKKNDIGFLSTAFDEEGLKYLATELDLPVIKISSGDLNNPLILLAAAASGKNIILSSGMSTLTEIESALAILAYGYLGNSDKPSLKKFKQAWGKRLARRTVLEKVTVLHCTTEYPTPVEDANLNAMLTIKEKFGVKVGYSDHTLSPVIPAAAVAMGATVIEKHFTLDRKLEGPDHIASLEPSELKFMIEQIRLVEKAKGHGDKVVAKSEIKNIPIARKSLVAAINIRAGETFTVNNLTIKRPGTGVSPLYFWDYIGLSADRDYLADELIVEK